MNRANCLTAVAVAVACGCASTPDEKRNAAGEVERAEDVVLSEIERGSSAPSDSADPLDDVLGLEGLGLPTPTPYQDYVIEEPSGKRAGMVTKFYRIRHVEGKVLKGVLDRWKSPRAEIIDHPDQNLLLITETKENMRALDEVLEQIDRARPQVEIEAKIVEIRKTDDFEFGFELQVDRAPASNSALRGYTGTFQSSSFLESLRPSASPFQGTSFTWASVGKVVEQLGDFEYIVHALEKEGYAEILSSPRVVVTSGKKAVMKTFQKIPVSKTNIVNTTLQQISIRFEDVGVSLEVTPRTIGIDAITIDVKPAVSSVVRFESDASGVPVPVISDRSMSTTLSVRNGELLIMGGLFEKRKRRDRTKVPILGDIPLIGRFFSSVNETSEKTDIVFFLQVRILNEMSKAAARFPLVPEGAEGR